LDEDLIDFLGKSKAEIPEFFRRLLCAAKETSFTQKQLVKDCETLIERENEGNFSGL